MPRLSFSTIKEAWANFRSKVISPNAPQIQIDEMRKAFYAGASSFYDIVMQNTELSEDDAMDRMEKLHQEFLDFVKEFKK